MNLKNKNTIIVIVVLGLVLILILCSCCSLYSFVLWRNIQGSDDSGDHYKEPTWTKDLSDSMETFASDNEFDKFIDSYEDDFEDMQKELETSQESTDGMGDASADSEGGESITNVQESGVDEGDIVKAYKDYLVVLRRGRLFTIKINNRGDELLDPISKLNAFPEGSTSGSWYDEMLIYENKIVVVGYSYAVSATELGIFNINDDGKLEHEDTYFLDSNDYYSSRNYASRLIDNELIIYMPYYLYTWSYYGDESERDINLPKVRKWIKNDKLGEEQDILQKTDIYKPLQDTYSPTLHTIVRCDLSKSDLKCSAKAILGPYSRNFYVSPNAIYIWVNEEYNWWLEEDEIDESEPNAYVYMILLKDDTARVLRADGSPIDQFSFKEDKYGYLNVLVTKYGGGDAMWNPEYNEGEPALFRVPITEFRKEAKLVSKDTYTELPDPEGYTMQNRYVGDYLLYGTGSGWYYDESAETNIYIKNYSNSDKTQVLDINHSVDRIEVLGEDAVIIGSNSTDLVFSSIDLKRNSSISDSYNVEDAVQGELRSHGFFFKSDGNKSGILGLPIRKQGESYEHLFDDSAEIIFLSVKNRKFSNLGSLKADPPDRENDDCEYSCVDWYGNARPIFYKDRIFGLLGYELVEGEVSRDNLNEIDRINFLSEL